MNQFNLCISCGAVDIFQSACIRLGDSWSRVVLIMVSAPVRG